MQEHDLFLVFLSRLEENRITYIITVSVAGIIYGEPRLTHDIDLVIDLNAESAHKIPNAFPEDEFYCPPLEVIKLEIKRPYRGHFNLIHLESGFKADIYLSGEDRLHEWAFENKLETTKITVHLIDAGVDTGPVLAQCEVDLRGVQTLKDVEQGGLKVEHQFFSEVLQKVFTGEIQIDA